MKTKITLALLLVWGFNLLISQTTFVHCATTENTFQTRTEIDHPTLNNIGDDVYIFVQKVRIDDNGAMVNNPYNISLYYNFNNSSKWSIINEGDSEMKVNSCYMVTVYTVTSIDDPFLSKIDPFTILSGFANTSVINNPAFNDNPSARSMVTKVRDADEVPNDNPCELYYNWETPGKWHISTPPGRDIPIGCAFNIIPNPSGCTIYEHESTFTNTGSEVNAIDDYAYWTILDHVLLNNNPDALLFVTHRREPATSFIFSSFSVFFNSVSGRWELHIELENYISDFSFPFNNFFDVFIFEASLGVDGVVFEEAVKVFPNPTNTLFNIQANETVSEVSIYNILGQQMERISGGNISQIDISHYKRGTYFVKTKMDEKTETVKLIKI